MSPPSPCPAASSSLQLETPVLRGVANRQLPSQSTQIIVISEQDSQPANARSESRRNNRRRGARTRRAKVLLIRQVHYDLHSVSVTWHVLPETGVAGLSIGSCRGPAAPSALTMVRTRLSHFSPHLVIRRLLMTRLLPLSSTTGGFNLY